MSGQLLGSQTPGICFWNHLHKEDFIKGSGRQDLFLQNTPEFVKLVHNLRLLIIHYIKNSLDEVAANIRKLGEESLLFLNNVPVDLETFLSVQSQDGEFGTDAELRAFLACFGLHANILIVSEKKWLADNIIPYLVENKSAELKQCLFYGNEDEIREFDEKPDQREWLLRILKEKSQEELRQIVEAVLPEEQVKERKKLAQLRTGLSKPNLSKKEKEDILNQISLLKQTDPQLYRMDGIEKKAPVNGKEREEGKNEDFSPIRLIICNRGNFHWEYRGFVHMGKEYPYQGLTKGEGDCLFYTLILFAAHLESVIKPITLDEARDDKARNAVLAQQQALERFVQETPDLASLETKLKELAYLSKLSESDRKMIEDDHQYALELAKEELESPSLR